MSKPLQSPADGPLVVLTIRVPAPVKAALIAAKEASGMTWREALEPVTWPELAKVHAAIRLRRAGMGIESPQVK